MGVVGRWVGVLSVVVLWSVGCWSVVVLPRLVAVAGVSGLLGCLLGVMCWFGLLVCGGCCRGVLCVPLCLGGLADKNPLVCSGWCRVVLFWIHCWGVLCLWLNPWVRCSWCLWVSLFVVVGLVIGSTVGAFLAGRLSWLCCWLLVLCGVLLALCAAVSVLGWWGWGGALVLCCWGVVLLGWWWVLVLPVRGLGLIPTVCAGWAAVCVLLESLGCLG